jgi:hypothetical protein
MKLSKTLHSTDASRPKVEEFTRRSNVPGQYGSQSVRLVRSNKSRSKKGTEETR